VPALVPSFHLVFAIAALIAAASVVATLFLRELPLRTTARADAAARR
jgi:archaellum component FlaG (FlaF/FlaG flagellin family)